MWANDKAEQYQAIQVNLLIEADEEDGVRSMREQEWLVGVIG